MQAASRLEADLRPWARQFWDGIPTSDPDASSVSTATTLTADQRAEAAEARHAQSFGTQSRAAFERTSLSEALIDAICRHHPLLADRHIALAAQLQSAPQVLRPTALRQRIDSRGTLAVSAVSGSHCTAVASALPALNEVASVELSVRLPPASDSKATTAWKTGKKVSKTQFQSLEPARAFMQSVADMRGKQLTRLAWHVPGAVPARLADAPHAVAYLLRRKLPWHVNADSGAVVPAPRVLRDDVPDDATHPMPWAPRSSDHFAPESQHRSLMCLLRSVKHRDTVRRLSVLHLPVAPVDDDLSLLASLSNLERLDICCHCSSFYHLRALFERLTSLRHVNVNGSPLGASNLSSLLSVLECAHLTALEMASVMLPRLHNQRAERCAAGCRTLASEVTQPLSRLTTLVRLDMSHNQIPPTESVYLAAQLAHLCRLEHLCIAGCGLTESGAAVFACELAALTRLTHLDVSGNPLGVGGGAALAPMLAGLELLAHLNLTRTGLLASSVADMAPCLAVLPQLSFLGLGQGADAARSRGAAIRGMMRALALEHRTSLRALSLGGFRLGLQADTVVDVAPEICMLESLTSLGLATSALGDDGAAALAPHLPALAELQVLDLGDNMIGCDGAAALAPQLAQLTQLRELLLRSNVLRADGAAALAPHMAALTRLERVDVSVNALLRQGVRVLARALAPHCAAHLQLLDMHGNHAAPEARIVAGVLGLEGSTVTGCVADGGDKGPEDAVESSASGTDALEASWVAAVILTPALTVVL